MAENINDGEATDHLRPEVRNAVERSDRNRTLTTRLVCEGDWHRIRAELERQAAEIAELRALLDDPGTTHSEGCWTWGPKHYGCAENRIKELEAELAALRVEL